MATSAADQAKLKAETTAAREALEKKQAAVYTAKAIESNKAAATAASVSRAGASATGALSKTELLSKAMAGLTAKTNALHDSGVKTYQSGGSTFQADKNTNSKIIDLDTYKQGDDAYGNGNNLTPTIPTNSSIGSTSNLGSASTLGGTSQLASGQTSTDLQSQMVDSAKSAAVTKFQNAYKNALALNEQQKADLAADTRTQTGQIRTDDTMARTGTQKIQATQGLAGAGAASQSDIAQNVIKQGATSTLTTQANQLKADINAQLAEALATRDNGIASVESEAEITKLQYQLDAIEKAEAETKAVEEQARADALATINASYSNFQAKIDELQNDGDPTNDYLIPYYQQAREGKLVSEGLDSQGNKTAETLAAEAQLTADQQAQANSIIESSAYKKLSVGIPLNAEEAALLGVKVGYTTPVATKSYSGGSSSSKSSSSNSSTYSGTPRLDAAPFSSYIDTQIKNGNMNDDELRDYISNLSEKGMADEVVMYLAMLYDIAEGQTTEVAGGIQDVRKSYLQNPYGLQ